MSELSFSSGSRCVIGSNGWFALPVSTIIRIEGNHPHRDAARSVGEPAMKLDLEVRRRDARLPDRLLGRMTLAYAAAMFLRVLAAVLILLSLGHAPPVIRLVTVHPVPAPYVRVLRGPG